jgi:hypothetical protein
LRAILEISNQRVDSDDLADAARALMLGDLIVTAHDWQISRGSIGFGWRIGTRLS